jgi:hypothetical protein
MEAGTLDPENLGMQVNGPGVNAGQGGARRGKVNLARLIFAVHPFIQQQSDIALCLLTD